MYKVWMFLCFPCCLFAKLPYDLPEIYQDVFIQGKVVKKGVRSCEDRYEAIRPVLETLPQGFKSLDIGASQGYFSFRFAYEYGARCTMIEDGYANTRYIWNTADYLIELCKANSDLRNLTVLKQKFFEKDFRRLRMVEEFDLVSAFSVIHHMRKSNRESLGVYEGVIDAILHLAPVALIENPVNTGYHTVFIRNLLLAKKGKCIFTTKRGGLTYEIYLFDRRNGLVTESQLPNLSQETYEFFHGAYSSLE